MIKKKLLSALLLIALTLPQFSLAEEAAGDAPKKKLEPTETLKARPKDAPLTAKYYRFEPDIVTNLALHKGRNKYVHMRVELMVDGAEQLKILEAVDPLLRDRLNNYFNGLSYIALKPGENRKTVKKKMLKIVNQALANSSHQMRVDRVLITKVIIE